MNIVKSLEIIRTLADGVSPYTGKEFSTRSAYQHPQTVRALYVAIHALERSQSQKFTGLRQKGPEKAGSPWDKSEERRLVKAFKSGDSIKRIAKKHQRTEGSIHARLVVLGIIKDPYALSKKSSKKDRQI